jgi:hypothetical protein
MTGKKFTEQDNKAISLYAVLARDPMDFIDCIDGLNPAVLRILYLMLTCKRENANTDHELNTIGADLVRNIAKRRDINLEKWQPHHRVPDWDIWRSR